MSLSSSVHAAVGTESLSGCAPRGIIPSATPKEGEGEGDTPERKCYSAKKTSSHTQHEETLVSSPRQSSCIMTRKLAVVLSNAVQEIATDRLSYSLQPERLLPVGWITPVHHGRRWASSAGSPLRPPARAAAAAATRTDGRTDGRADNQTDSHRYRHRHSQPQQQTRTQTHTGTG
eukprot:gene10962-biopygen3328